MGPRSDERGNRKSSLHLEALLELQWGRAQMSAEIQGDNNMAASAFSGFNGAALR